MYKRLAENKKRLFIQGIKNYDLPKRYSLSCFTIDFGSENDYSDEDDIKELFWPSEYSDSEPPCKFLEIEINEFENEAKKLRSLKIDFDKYNYWYADVEGSRIMASEIRRIKRGKNVEIDWYPVTFNRINKEDFK